MKKLTVMIILALSIISVVGSIEINARPYDNDREYYNALMNYVHNLATELNTQTNGQKRMGESFNNKPLQYDIGTLSPRGFNDIITVSVSFVYPINDMYYTEVTGYEWETINIKGHTVYIRMPKFRVLLIDGDYDKYPVYGQPINRFVTDLDKETYTYSVWWRLRTQTGTRYVWNREKHAYWLGVNGVTPQGLYTMYYISHEKNLRFPIGVIDQRTQTYIPYYKGVIATVGNFSTNPKATSISQYVDDEQAILRWESGHSMPFYSAHWEWNNDKTRIIKMITMCTISIARGDIVGFFLTGFYYQTYNPSKPLEVVYFLWTGGKVGYDVLL